jgi:patatin-like phospholipase/acyl hydrolase
VADAATDTPYRVLTLDGGGAKGFYTLGVLREIEGLVSMPLHEKFDLIFGTSTGAIIAATYIDREWLNPHSSFIAGCARTLGACKEAP